MPTIEVRPIGCVRNAVERPTSKGWEDVVSEIVVDACPDGSLQGIEANSHVTIIFWFDRITEGDRQTSLLHPKGRTDLPLSGILATR